MTEKEREVQPRFRVTLAEVDVLAIFPLGGGGILFLFGDAGVDPMLAARVHGSDELRLLAGLLLAPADDSGRCDIELSQVESCFNVFRIQLPSTFELSPRFSGQARRAKEICPIGLFAVNAPQPKMVTAVALIERDRFSAGGFRTIPLFEREVSAAKQVGRFRVRRS